MTKATAFHEAGHAVVAFCEGVRLKRLVLGSDDDANGSATFRPLFRSLSAETMSPRQERRLLSSVRISLAGAIAQRKAFHRSVRRWQSEDDENGARERVEWFLSGQPRPSSDELASAHLEVARIEASLILESRWNLVEALAGALLDRRTMTGKEAESLLRERLRLAMSPTPTRKATRNGKSPRSGSEVNRRP